MDGAAKNVSDVRSPLRVWWLRFVTVVIGGSRGAFAVFANTVRTPLISATWLTRSPIG